jgi:cytochrome c
MKTSNLFVLGLLALTFASCASPEERAAKKNNPVDTNKTNPSASMSAETLDSNQLEGSATKREQGGGAAPGGTATTEGASASGATNANGAAAATGGAGGTGATGATGSSGTTGSTSTAASPAAEKTAKAEAPKAGPGEALIKKSDCLACHNAKVKIVGPAYVAVAAKYPATPANIDKLANKIIAGGAGAWGEVPMSPHPTLSISDAKEMVKYILSLKK